MRPAPRILLTATLLAATPALAQVPVATVESAAWLAGCWPA